MRRHLTVLLLLGVGGLCVGGGALAYRSVHAAVLAEFDYALRTKAHDFATLSEWENDRYELEFADKPMPEFERREHPEYFQVRVGGTDVLMRSLSLGEATLAMPDLFPSTEPSIYRLELPSGMPGRAAAVAVVLGGKRLDIIVARDTVRLEHLFHSLAGGFSAATLLILLAMAVGLNLLVKHGLRPLAAFANQTGSIDSANLGHRFTSPTLPAELRPIALQLDRLLERIATAFQRERYLTSAMAHELYTPIAELRSLTEVALKWPDDPASAPEAVADAHAIALQMQEMVNALLALSRYEAGRQEVETAALDVAELLDALRHSLEEPLGEKRIAAIWKWEPGLIVETDRTMLEAILENLVRNAVEYTPEGGRFECRAEMKDGDCVLAMANTQETLSEMDLEHLFEPLWRKDKARTGSTHCGLGLAVSERFCHVLGMQLTAALPKPSRFEVTLTIPER